MPRISTSRRFGCRYAAMLQAVTPSGIDRPTSVGKFCRHDGTILGPEIVSGSARIATLDISRNFLFDFQNTRFATFHRTDRTGSPLGARINCPLARCLRLTINKVLRPRESIAKLRSASRTWNRYRLRLREEDPSSRWSSGLLASSSAAHFAQDDTQLHQAPFRSFVKVSGARQPRFSGEDKGREGCDFFCSPRDARVRVCRDLLEHRAISTLTRAARLLPKTNARAAPRDLSRKTAGEVRS